MNTKTRRIIGWILTAILALVFIGSAVMKLMASPEMIKSTAAMGLTADSLRIIGIVELLCILLFIFPRTGLLGSLLLSAYVGGAIATHIEHAQPVMIPVIIECVVFITAAIRFPELTRRLMGSTTI